MNHDAQHHANDQIDTTVVPQRATFGAVVRKARRHAFPHSCEEGPSAHVLHGWTLLETDDGGVPVWKHYREAVYVVTRDTDQLRFLGAALVRFERMSPHEFVDFMNEAAP